MNADDVLVHELHQVLLTDGQNIYALQLLAQIHSRHGRTGEAVQTVKNLLKIDRYGLDRETRKALSPAVLKILEKSDGRHDLPLTPPESPREARNGFVPSSYDHPTYLPPGSTARLSRKTSNSDPSGFRRFFNLSFRSKRPENRDTADYDDGPNPPPPRRDSQLRKSTSPNQLTKPTRPPPLEDVVARMASDPPRSLITAINDLTSLLSFSRQQSPSPSDDQLRSACVARSNALASALHPKYAYLAPQALMHLTHEHLPHNYANSETMIAGDPLSSIPRSRFFASEDNYAWDMSELVSALKANPASSFRNPLSRAPFTEADVQAIVHHPLGRELRAVQVQQRELRKGVRKETVEKMEKLAKVMLEDEDSMEKSREAMDEFAGYVASLPGHEREALWRLRVPAMDSHTGMGYDASVGEMVADAKGNQVCGHKAGDFLAQAVKYLRGSRR